MSGPAAHSTDRCADTEDGASASRWARALVPAGLMTAQGLGMALAGPAAEFFAVHQVVAGSGVAGTVRTLLLVAEVRRTRVRYRKARRG